MTHVATIDAGYLHRLTYHLRGWVMVEYSADRPVILRIRPKDDEHALILETGRARNCLGVGFRALVRLSVVVELENPVDAEGPASIALKVVTYPDPVELARHRYHYAPGCLTLALGVLLVLGMLFVGAIAA